MISSLHTLPLIDITISSTTNACQAQKNSCTSSLPMLGNILSSLFTNIYLRLLFGNVWQILFGNIRHLLTPQLLSVCTKYDGLGGKKWFHLQGQRDVWGNHLINIYIMMKCLFVCLFFTKNDHFLELPHSIPPSSLPQKGRLGPPGDTKNHYFLKRVNWDLPWYT